MLHEEFGDHVVIDQALWESVVELDCKDEEKVKLTIEFTHHDETLCQKEAEFKEKRSLWANHLETKEYQNLLRSNFSRHEVCDSKFGEHD